jgi:hypothetical protein
VCGEPVDQLRQSHGERVDVPGGEFHWSSSALIPMQSFYQTRQRTPSHTSCSGRRLMPCPATGKIQHRKLRERIVQPT